MTTALLLRDAEAALTRAARHGEVTALEAAFQCWLRGEPPPSAADQTFASPLRDYVDVALAALGEVAGWSIDSTRLEDGLRWLVDVALDRVGVPAPVVTDGLAHVCLGLAARERPWLAAWHDQVLARAADTIQPTWLVGGGRVVRGQASICAPELRVALASRGAATSTDAEANAVLEELLKGELPDDALHAQVLLAALAWIRRAAPVALPGQATPETVARLLAEARALVEKREAQIACLVRRPWGSHRHTDIDGVDSWEIHKLGFGDVPTLRVIQYDGTRAGLLAAVDEATKS